MRIEMKAFFASMMVGATLLAAPAFAIDQIRLGNGELVEGTILNDVPNRHVDIRLSNGRVQRFQKTEVASIERDVPSSKDSSMRGSESRGWVSLLLGGHVNMNQSAGTVNPMNFMFGFKAGVHTANLDFARLSFAISYDYVNQSTPFGVISVSSSYHDLNLQGLLTRVGGSGLYLGPNLGLAMFSNSNAFSPVGSSSMSSNFEFGVGAGYELFVSPSFAIGPDLRYEHIFTVERNAFKFALQGSFQF